jgi:hypothetical protein
VLNPNTKVYEFLGNPFLVSLLYKSYSFNEDIPTKKSSFYEEVYSSLYKYHDLSKEGFKGQKKSNLDILDFRIILRAIAFESALGKTEGGHRAIVFLSSSSELVVQRSFPRRKSATHRTKFV